MTVMIAFLKWLGDKFDKLSRAIQETNNTTQIWLRDHEEKDQERHIDNLHRFEKIAIALAKLGSDNEVHP